ncbi:hypothetical protein DL95DRAFT_349969 [Leptodontidium sp. 2 PMI_412]|nr:hypothetical protein DL95DRAFT_349969 [Leptodontidium sp. 2 PMI_412]
MGYLRELGFGAIGTARVDSGGHHMMAYNELHIAYSPDNMVMHALWNDNAPSLFMSNCDDGHGTVNIPRHRPGETSANAAVARAWFGEETTKDLDEPFFAWLYNQFMNALDVGDQLKSYNSGDRAIRRGGWQALWQWLFNTILCNCYLLSIHANVDDHWHVTDKDK